MVCAGEITNPPIPAARARQMKATVRLHSHRRLRPCLLAAPFGETCIAGNPTSLQPPACWFGCKYVRGDSMLERAQGFRRDFHAALQRTPHKDAAGGRKRRQPTDAV